jgi:transcriptional regulator GlxA family with amidase domain
MKKVSILALETAIPAGIIDARYMFTAVNEFFRSAGHLPFFRIEVVGNSSEVQLNDGLITVHPDVLAGDVAGTDLIIIPPLSGNMQQAIDSNRVFIPWIIDKYHKGAEAASLCTGAFMLAATGLLDKKSCSTHWLFANDFRNMFPEVDLVDARVITDQNGLYSSGGATSLWNLLLYLVEKYTSREMAVMASKFFLLDIEKNSQLPFSVFKAQKEHGDDMVLSVQEFIEGNYQTRLSIDDLATRYRTGRRTFERRFKKATSNTPVEYIQRVKVEAAKKQLESGRKTVNEVMYDVGYNDTKAFRDVFKRITGLSPLDYRSKFNTH